MLAQWLVDGRLLRTERPGVYHVGDALNAAVDVARTAAEARRTEEDAAAEAMAASKGLPAKWLVHFLGQGHYKVVAPDRKTVYKSLGDALEAVAKLPAAQRKPAKLPPKKVAAAAPQLARSAASRGTKRKAIEPCQQAPEKALKAVPRDLIGARVQKRFPGYGMYAGTVQRRANREGHFDVQWSDGDTTTMTAQAIAKHLC